MGSVGALRGSSEPNPRGHRELRCFAGLTTYRMSAGLGRRHGRQLSCGQLFDQSFGFGEAELAGDQARKKGVAEFAEGAAVLLVCLDFVEDWDG